MFPPLKQIQDLLEETQSVGVTAAILGIRIDALSRFLNHRLRKKWWEAMKNSWKRGNHAARMRRYRRGSRARALVDRVTSDPRVWLALGSRDRALLASERPDLAFPTRDELATLGALGTPQGSDNGMGGI